MAKVGSKATWKGTARDIQGDAKGRKMEVLKDGSLLRGMAARDTTWGQGSWESAPVTYGVRWHSHLFRLLLQGLDFTGRLHCFSSWNSRLMFQAPSDCAHHLTTETISLRGKQMSPIKWHSFHTVLSLACCHGCFLFSRYPDSSVFHQAVRAASAYRRGRLQP